MQKKQLFRRHAAVLTAAALTVVSLPVVAASSAEYNTWTGYVLRNAAGQYLSVSGGTEGEGAQVGFYDADGVAPYNTWYFTETELGITIKIRPLSGGILPDGKRRGEPAGAFHSCRAV